MAYMKFEFVLKTNSDDVPYEEQRSEALVKRILGSYNVFEYHQVETLVDYDPIFSSPDRNAESE